MRDARLPSPTHRDPRSLPRYVRPCVSACRCTLTCHLVARLIPPLGVNKMLQRECAIWVPFHSGIARDRRRSLWLNLRFDDAALDEALPDERGQFVTDHMPVVVILHMPPRQILHHSA